jgi:hypothetical protein
MLFVSRPLALAGALDCAVTVFHCTPFDVVETTGAGSTRGAGVCALAELVHALGSGRVPATGVVNGDLCVVVEAQSPAFAEKPGCDGAVILLSEMRKFDGGEPSPAGVLTYCDAGVTGVELLAAAIAELGAEAGSVFCGEAAPGGAETCERAVTGFPPESALRAGSSAGGKEAVGYSVGELSLRFHVE